MNESQRSLSVRECRNGITEADHPVCVASSDEGWLTDIIWAEPMPVRSTGKPILLALSFESVGLDLNDFTPAEIAIMSASHNGELRHRNVLHSILERAGLAPTDLHIGRHLEIVQADSRPGYTETRLSHNCSGKHVASLLVLAKEEFAGTYLDPTRPLFGYIKLRLSEVLDRDVSFVTDGCGYPTPCLTLPELAKVYAKPEMLSKNLPTVMEAMLGCPWAVAGARRLTTDLLARGMWTKEGYKGLSVFRPKADGRVFALKCLSGSDSAGESALYALARQVEPGLPERSDAGIYPDEIIRTDTGTPVGRVEVYSTLQLGAI